MMKIGIRESYTCKDFEMDYFELIKRVGALGYDAVELNPNTVMKLTKDKRQDLKKLAADNNLLLTFSFGLSPETDVSSLDEGVRNNGVKHMKEILGIVHEMGGDTIGGCIYSYWPYNYQSGSHDRERLMDASVKSVKEIIKVAEDFGIDYAIEILNRFEQIIMNTAEEAVAYLKRIDSPRAKLNLDTFHMNIEEDSIEGALLTAKDYLVDLHVNENNRKFPGMGTMNWKSYIDVLKSYDYDKYIVLEPFMLAGGAVSECVYLWRDLTNNANETEIDAMAKRSLEYLRGLM